MLVPLSDIYVLLLLTLVKTCPRKAFADEMQSLLTPYASEITTYSVRPLTAPSQGSNPQSQLPVERKTRLWMEARLQLRWTPPSFPTFASLPLTFRWACSLMRW